MNSITIFSSGILTCNNKQFRCALGKNGVTENKQEGDGATPVGCFSIRKVFYRADKITKPATALSIKLLDPNDGWCNDSNDSNYNQLVKLPYPANAEELWRSDNLYDIIVVLGYNDAPAIPGKGSAIFMHIARPDYSPTAGCIALSLNDLLEILNSVDSDTLICVQSQ